MEARRLALMLVTAGAMALGGCDYLSFGYTQIGEILSAPARYEGSR